MIQLFMIIYIWKCRSVDTFIKLVKALEEVSETSGESLQRTKNRHASHADSKVCSRMHLMSCFQYYVHHRLRPGCARLRSHYYY